MAAQKARPDAPRHGLLLEQEDKCLMFTGRGKERRSYRELKAFRIRVQSAMVPFWSTMVSLALCFLSLPFFSFLLFFSSLPPLLRTPHQMFLSCSLPHPILSYPIRFTHACRHGIVTHRLNFALVHSWRPPSVCLSTVAGREVLGHAPWRRLHARTPACGQGGRLFLLHSHGGLGAFLCSTFMPHAALRSHGSHRRHVLCPKVPCA